MNFINTNQKLHINRESLDHPPIEQNPVWYDQIALLKLIQQIIKNNQRTSQNFIQDDAGWIYTKSREDRLKINNYKDDLPLLDTILDVYSDILNKTIDVAQERNIRLIFATHPCIWHKDLPEELQKFLWFGRPANYGIDVSFFYSASALKTGLDRYNNTLLDICQKRNIKCIDFLNS